MKLPNYTIPITTITQNAELIKWYVHPQGDTVVVEFIERIKIVDL